MNVQAFEESGRLCAAITNGARCALKGEELMQVEGAIRQLNLVLSPEAIPFIVLCMLFTVVRL